MNVTLSSNITSMGESAFDGCNSLKNLAISNNVTSIKDICFNLSTDNLELESVYVGWQNPIEAGSFFDNIEISKCILYVPQGTKMLIQMLMFGETLQISLSIMLQALTM